MKRPKTCAREGRWQEDEHERFLKAIRIYGSNWKAVEIAVGTRTATQARSHAQKHFIRENKRKREVESMRKKTGDSIEGTNSVAVQYGAGVLFMEGEPLVSDSTAECSYVKYDDLEPLEPAPETYEGLLKSLDWKVQFAAITALRQLNKHNGDVFLSLIDTLLPLLITLSDSIRSNLSKNALLLINEMFLEPRPSHSHIAEALIPGLLQKTISEKSFIKQQAAAAMQNLSRTAGTPAVMQALASLCWHKSGAICDNAFLYLKTVYETAPCDDVFHSAVGLLHSKRKKIEAGAIAALKSLQENPRFPSLLEPMDPALRTEVERAISSRSGPTHGKDIKSFIEERKKALHDNP